MVRMCTGSGRVDAIDHRRERGRLARTRRAHHEHDAVRLVEQRGARRRSAELFERTDAERHDAESERKVAALAEGVRTETTEARNAEREVDLMLLTELFELALVEQRMDHPVDLFGREHRHVLERHEGAVAARRGRSTDGEVEVGRAGFDGRPEERHEHRVCFLHDSLISRSGQSRPQVLMSLPLLIFVVVVAGLVIGSFLTVVVDRVPRGESVVAPPSRCGSCGLRLGPLDLVPVVSWVALRGKCRQCRAPIGIEPIIIELATAGIFVLFALKFEDTAPLPAYCILGAVLVAQTWIDLHTQRLPREITYTGIVLGAISLTIAAIVIDEPERIWMMVLGALIALAAMWLIFWASKGGMGEGDVRLAPLLGMYLGWLNPGIVLPGLFFGFIAGAVVGVAMMAGNKAGRRTAVPFGPFLALGTVVAIFYGQHFVDLVLAR